MDSVLCDNVEKHVGTNTAQEGWNNPVSETHWGPWNISYGYR